MTASYKIGDTIEYRALDGELRLVVVDQRDPAIKHGDAGFFGRVVDRDGQDVPDPIEPDRAFLAWGYDDQILRVVR